MFCRNCGLLNETDATRCVRCGGELSRWDRKSGRIFLLVIALLLAIVIGVGVLLYGMLADKTEEILQEHPKAELTAPVEQMETVEIRQVLPCGNGSVAVVYTDGTVRLSGNDEFAAAVSGWTQVAKLYYREQYIWENGADRTEISYIGLKEDGTVLTTDGSLSGWSNVKEIYDYWQGVVAVTHDGRVLAEGGWEDPSFLTDLTDVDVLVPGDLQAAWGCLKKDGTVVFVSDMDGICAYMPQWSNVKELRNSGHGFYVLKNDGTVDAEIEDYFDGLTGAVMVTDWRDWIFGISPDGQLLTHNGGSIYPNTGCMMVDEPGLPYYGEEADIRRFNQVRDIIQSFGLVILNKDGTAEHIGDCPHWEISSWKNIESIHALTNYDGDAYYLYGIQRNGSVVRNRYDWQQDEQTVEEQYRGWQLQELYVGDGGVVGLTPEGKLVGDGIYETVDFSVFDR